MSSAKQWGHAKGSCSAQAKNPSRDLPIAILGSLSVATILYILMALAITMMVRIAAPVYYENPPVTLISPEMSLLSTLRSLWRSLHGVQWLFKAEAACQVGRANFGHAK